MEPPREIPAPPVEKPRQPEVKRKPDFDALVVLGKNWREAPKLPAESTANLSVESRIGALAAGILYESGTIGKIIFTGGVTKEGRSSEADAMARYLRRRFPNIPETAVMLEEEAIDTRDNAEKTATLLKNQNVENAALLTFGYHAGRAKRVFERFGFDIDQIFTSDEIAKTHTEHSRWLLEKFAKSKHIKKERIREGILKATSLIDRKERIPRFFATRVRKRGSK